MGASAGTLAEASPEERDDRGLVADFLELRDERAFRVLYRRHTPLLYGMAMRLTADPTTAEELVEDAWARAAARLDRFEWRSKLSTWLGGIVVNCHRERTRLRVLDTDPGVSPDEVGQAPPPTGTLLDLERSIARLPAGYREVVVLNRIYGYTHREIAERLGIQEGTSKSQLARGLARLRELMA